MLVVYVIASGDIFACCKQSAKQKTPETENRITLLSPAISGRHAIGTSDLPSSIPLPRRIFHALPSRRPVTRLTSHISKFGLYLSSAQSFHPRTLPPPSDPHVAATSRHMTAPSTFPSICDSLSSPRSTVTVVVSRVVAAAGDDGGSSNASPTPYSQTYTTQSSLSSRPPLSPSPPLTMPPTRGYRGTFYCLCFRPLIQLPWGAGPPDLLSLSRGPVSALLSAPFASTAPSQSARQ